MHSLKYFNGCIRSLSIDFALYISKCRDANKSWMVKNEKYVQAYQLNPKAALPLLGLAQMTLSEKDNTNAITLLETALQLHPGWNDALMVSCLFLLCLAQLHTCNLLVL